MFNVSLDGATVGTKLYIETTNAGFGIDEVVEITKAGNYKTAKSGIFSKDGTMRGGHDRFYRTRARIATAMDIEAVRRAKKLRFVKKYQSWDAVSEADLDTVLAVLKKYQA